ncbi:hypothetical protein N9414_04595 [Nodularia spumigena CCY9414]|nr:hypothetical protein N9414_04595 [Nodularia spumigena CCY9414]
MNLFHAKAHSAFAQRPEGKPFPKGRRKGMKKKKGYFGISYFDSATPKFGRCLFQLSNFFQLFLLSLRPLRLVRLEKTFFIIG